MVLPAAPPLCPALTGAEEPNQAPNPGILEMDASRAGPRALAPGSLFLGPLCSTGSQTPPAPPGGWWGVPAISRGAEDTEGVLGALTHLGSK